MTSFLRTLPSAELDDLIALVSSSQTRGDEQPSLIQRQRIEKDMRRAGIKKPSALAFLLPKEIAIAGVDHECDSPTTRSPHTFKPQKLDYFAGLADQRRKTTSRETTIHSNQQTDTSACLSSSQHSSLNPSISHSSAMMPLDSEPTRQTNGVDSAPTATVNDHKTTNAFPYCTVAAHTHIDNLDMLEAYPPDESDFTSLRALDDLHSKVRQTRAVVETHSEELSTIKDTLVRRHIADIRQKLIDRDEESRKQFDEYRDDKAAADRLRASAEAKMTTTTMRSSPSASPSRAMRSSTNNPYLHRMQELKKRQEERRLAQSAFSSTYDPTSAASPSTAPCAASTPSSLDPLSNDIIHQLTTDLIALQKECASLRREKSRIEDEYKRDLQHRIDEWRVEKCELKREYEARLHHRDQLHAERLTLASQSGAHELPELRKTISDQAASLQRVRELLRVWMKEHRGPKERKTRSEQALLELLAQPFFMESTLPPSEYPFLNHPQQQQQQPHLHPTTGMSSSSSSDGPSHSHSQSQPSIIPPRFPAEVIPPFASSLVTSVPTSSLPVSLVNEELTHLRLQLRQCRDEIRSLRSAEETARKSFAELVLTHKQFKTDACKKRLRMQAQLLGSVRRVKYLADEKTKLEQQLNEAQTHSQQLETKLLQASKRLLIQQEHAERATTLREARQANQAMVKRRSASMTRIPQQQQPQQQHQQQHQFSYPKRRMSGHKQHEWTVQIPHKERSPHQRRQPQQEHQEDMNLPQQENDVHDQAEEYAQEWMGGTNDQARSDPSCSTSNYSRSFNAPAPSHSFIDFSYATSTPPVESSIPPSTMHSHSSPPRPTSSLTPQVSTSSVLSSPPPHLSSPEADRWMASLESEVAALQAKLETNTHSSLLYRPLPSPTRMRATDNPGEQSNHPMTQQIHPPIPDVNPSNQFAAASSATHLNTEVASSLSRIAHGLDDDDSLMRNSVLDDTSVDVDSFSTDLVDDDDDYDDEELIRTFSSHSSSFANSLLQSSTGSLKDQIAQLQSVKHQLDQQMKASQQRPQQ